MKHLLHCAFTFLVVKFTFLAAAFAQTGPPATDVYLLNMKSRDGHFELGKPVNVTNREGYDNQPSFLPDGQCFLYTSIREDGQADIYKYDVADSSAIRVTQTPESEYSPTVTPDGRHFSVVRVETDSTQRLWQFPLGGGEPILILPDVKPVGYHAWGDAHTVALFVLGNPPTLQLADIPTGKAEAVSGNIGRSLHKVPRRNAISFVHKASENEWMIKQLDLKTRQVTPLVKTLPGSEDYAWTPQGVLLMGRNSKLYKYDPAKDKEWQEIADFSDAGIKTITRLAVSPSGDRLALVSH
jgi:dipeptidyl aminopeptidase/acylaminoacyl peptidase